MFCKLIKFKPILVTSSQLRLVVWYIPVIILHSRSKSCFCRGSSVVGSVPLFCEPLSSQILKLNLVCLLASNKGTALHLGLFLAVVCWYVAK